MSKRALWLAFGALSVGFVVVSCSSSDGGANFDSPGGAGGDDNGSGATSSKAGTKGGGGSDAQAGADSGNGGTNGTPEGGTSNMPEGGSSNSAAGDTGDGGTGSGNAGAPSGDGGTGGDGGLPTVTCESFKECGDGEVCVKEGCGQQKVGVCTKASQSPVCGCDGNTYYNGSLVAGGETEVRGKGVCNGEGAVTCDGECKEGYVCGKVPLRGGNCDAKLQGVCWRVPKECPEEPATYGFCSSDKCMGLCAAVKTGEQALVDVLGCGIINQ